MKTWVKRTLIGCGVLFSAALLAGGVAAFSVYKWAVADLPTFTRLADYAPPRATTVLARDGSQLGLLYNEKRFIVPLSEMSPFLPKALLAVEDADFYSHKGVDPIAILRAFIVNLKSGKHSQGGSTITQQVIKRLLLSPERTYERKLKEAILAYRLEKHLSKDEILALYLNQSFLGSGAYGVEAAARTYFGKHAKDLTLAESALLAGLPQAPSGYNPYRNPDAARARQLHVLDRMKDLGWITPEEDQAARAEVMNFRSMPENMGRIGAWYLEEVRRELIEIFSEEKVRARGLTLPFYGEQAVYELGLTVKTAMEPSAQLAADTALREGLEAADKRQGWRGPLAKLSATESEAAIAVAKFQPADLANGAWVKGVVTKVTAKSAEVRLGAYTGHITPAAMSWARVPNINVSASRSGSVTDARKVLAAGDMIWVSAWEPADSKTKKIIPYNPAAITRETSIPLRLQQYPEVQGAMVSIEPETGDVIAVCGGYSFLDSQFNRATQARRQPGSSFKPVVYSAALDAGFTPMSIVMDAPVVVFDDTTGDIWRPGNFEKNFRGPLPMRTALALSRNLCTIRVAQQIGVDAVITRAKELGLSPTFPRFLGISLGAVEVTPLNLAEAYTAFADKGMRAKGRFILSVTDAEGKLLYSAEPEKSRAITPQNAYLMDYMLKQVIQAGTGTRAKVLNRPLAGKTGTSNEERDAWFLGFTPHLVTATYVGFDQSRPMGRGETGSSAALPIFVNYGKKILEAYPPDDFPAPETGIEMAFVDRNTGRLASKNSDNAILVPFYAGTTPAASPVSGGTSGDTSQQGEELLKNLF